MATERSVLRIFVSSTAQDLAQYREGVDRAIQRLDYRSIGIETLSADPAVPEAPVAECIRRAASADVLVVVVAERYGWTPREDEGGDGQRSITWLEVEAARAAGRPIFAFLVADDSPLNRPKEVDRLVDPATSSDPARMAEVVASVQGSQRFKQWLLEEARAVARFASMDEFVYRVGSSLSRWISEVSGGPPSRSKEASHVFLGIQAPVEVGLGQRFVARFAAYTDVYRDHVIDVLNGESQQSISRLDIETCRWRIGTQVAVHLHSEEMVIDDSIQTFVWDGKWKVLRYDVRVRDRLPQFDRHFQLAIKRSIHLRCDVWVQGLRVAALRPELELQHRSWEKAERMTEVTSPKTAFASYACEDRVEVLGRVRSVQIATGMDVFVDCLSIRPGEVWKTEIRREISARESFWLFWSRRARASQWVDWEWRTALTERSIWGISPHPLEPAELSPPPRELAELQFGSMYETYLAHLRSAEMQS